jgi:hypothetical protein
MTNKAADQLQQIFDEWKAYLATLTPNEIHQPNRYGIMSIKDVIAHLMTWQNRSNLRLQAAKDGVDPVFPGWPTDLDQESDDDVDAINAWIYKLHQNDLWENVYAQWTSGFQRLIDASQAFPPAQFSDKSAYPWLNGYSLEDVVIGSYNHHIEHLDPLRVQ